MSTSYRLCPDGLYNYAVDIWSCGCILAEMLGRNPLFPGKNFVHQLSLVFDVIGSPVESDVRHIVNHEAKKFLASQSGKNKIPFRKIYPNASSDAWALLDCLLVFNPEQRLTVDEALMAPYLVGAGLPASAEFPPISPDFEFSFESNASATRHQLKHMISLEAASFRREQQALRRAELGEPAAEATPPTKPVTSAQEQLRQQEESKAKDSRQMGRNPSSGALNNSRSASAPRMRPSASASTLNKPTDAGVPRKPAVHNSKPPLVHPQPHGQSQSHHRSDSSVASNSSTVDNRAAHPHHHHNHSSSERDDSAADTVDMQRSASQFPNGSSGPRQSVDGYDLLFRPKPSSAAPLPAAEAFAEQPRLSEKMSIPEMIAQITAATAVDQFQNVSLQNYGSPGPKSPAKSLRYSAHLAAHTSQADYELVHSPSKGGGDSSRSGPPLEAARSPERRSIQQTYMSPQRIVNRHSISRFEGKEDDCMSPQLAGSRPGTAANNRSPMLPLYNSMAGLFDRSDRHRDQDSTSLLHYGAGPTDLPFDKSNTAKRSSSEEEEEEGDGSSTDSSDAGTLQKVHVYSDSRVSATQYAHKAVVAQPAPHRAVYGNADHSAGHRSEYTAKAEAEEDAKYSSYLRGVAAQQSPVHREDAPAFKQHTDVLAGGAALGAGQAKKKITVAKSPKFSTMSWQRGRDAAQPAVPPNVTGTLGADKRSTSNLRGHLPARDERQDDAADRTAANKAPAKVPSYMSATGSYANKTNARSESAPRGSRR